MSSISKLLIAFLALITLATACGGSTATETSANESTTTSEAAAASTSAPDAVTEAPDEAAETGSTDEINGGKPVVEIPEGDAPTELETIDLIDGDGEAAEAGDFLVMHYVGVLHDGGEQFDASWDRGSTFSFTLGQGNVIQGWDDGIEGMMVGGRRLLNIPPDQAYGERDTGTIPANSALVFVVDLVSVLTPPTVENVAEPATELEVTVVDEGDGPEVGAASIVEVHYVLLSQPTGEVVDSSWNRGQALQLQLGAGQALPEWDIGLAGKNVGDTVRFVIPNIEGLGDPIPDGSTLVTEVTIIGLLG